MTSPTTGRYAGGYPDCYAITRHGMYSVLSVIPSPPLPSPPVNHPFSRKPR